MRAVHTMLGALKAPCGAHLTTWSHRLQFSSDAKRVTCKRCLRILVNAGQTAEGKLRAAEEGVSNG
jgi:RNase P subunit RPR2